MFEHMGQVLMVRKGNACMVFESQNAEIFHKRRKRNYKLVEEMAKSTQELKSLDIKSSNRKGTMRGNGKRKCVICENKELNKSNCLST